MPEGDSFIDPVHC